MNLTLKIDLWKDRSRLGSAHLVTAAGEELLGPLDCLAISDNFAAIAHGNPLHDPLKQFGNTPTGLYLATLIPAAVADLNGYGPERRILLVPKAGPCVLAESEPNNRSGLLCHGGALNPNYRAWHGLRPTFGCVRFTDAGMKSILAILDKYAVARAETFEVSIEEKDSQTTAS